MKNGRKKRRLKGGGESGRLEGREENKRGGRKKEL